MHLSCKKAVYQRRLGDVGFQFERFITGHKVEDCADYSSVEHLHTMRVGHFMFLFDAEVDAMQVDGSIVEIKASNPTNRGIKTLFQMISSGSSFLCHGNWSSGQ